VVHERTGAGVMSGTSTVGTTQEVPHRLPVKTLVAASIGNAIEWYDWTVYATFVVYFSTQFFPKDDPSLALIQSTATYAVAFFFRPVGGWLLGRFADVRGRKAAMILTILLMAGGSLAIGILPTFEQVGWLAPILLLLARISQGLSLGGEVSNASAYLAEIAPRAAGAGIRRSSTPRPVRRCCSPRCSASCSRRPSPTTSCGRSAGGSRS
jgi:MFS family permease